MRYIDLVNVKQGTASKHRFSNGNTLPLTQLPFAMLGFAAQTENHGGWYFHPDDRSLEGVRLTIFTGGPDHVVLYQHRP